MLGRCWGGEIMTDIKWVPIYGRGTIEGNSIKYIPEKFLNIKTNKEELKIAILSSNLFFENGTIDLVIKVKDFTARCEVALKQSDLSEVHIGIANGSFNISVFKDGNWDLLLNVGDMHNFELNSSIKLSISVMGSNIDYYVNDVLIGTVQKVIKKSQLQLVLLSAEEIIVKDFNVTTDTPKVFVVMQFTEEYNQLYFEVIKPITEKFGLECIRADEFFTPGTILQDIINSIRESSLIIADITPNNPNVFYEVGYAHAINKPTILLCDKKRDKLPFDTSSFRTLFYENTIAGKTAVENNLIKFLTTLGYTEEN